jgi:hypothetical protein
MDNTQFDLSGATVVPPEQVQNQNQTEQVQNQNQTPQFDLSGATISDTSPVKPTDMSQPGVFQSIVQGIAKPFLNAAASVDTVGEGALAVAGKVGSALGIPGSEEFKNNRIEDIENLSKGVSVPYLGTATPWGSQIGENGLTPMNAVKTAAGIAGDGIQIASWFLAPEIKGIPGAAPMDLSKGATGATSAMVGQTPQIGFMKGILNTVKNGLPFSLLQAASTGLTDISQGKDKGNILPDSLMNLAGNVAGFAFMGGATGILKNYGALVLKNDVVQAANRSLSDDVSQILGIGEDALDHTTTALQNKVEQDHAQLVQGVADTINTKTDQSDLWKTISNKFQPYVQSLYKDAQNPFAELAQKDPQIESEFPSVMEEIGKSKDYIDSLYPNANVEIPSGKVSPEDYASLSDTLQKSQADNKALSKSGLNDYINKIQSIIGDGKNTVNYSQVQSLIDQGDLIAGETPAAQGKINSIQKLLRDDAINGLKSKPDTIPLAEIWEKGMSDTKDVSVFMKGKVAPALRAGTQVNDFISSLFKGSAPSSDEATGIVKGLGGIGSDATNAFSELIKNKLVENAIYANSDLSIGGKMIDDFLGKWENTNILSPKDVETLTDFSNLMQQDYPSIVDGVKGMVARNAPETNGVITDTLGKSQEEIQAAQTQADKLAGISNSLKGKDLFVTNPDGSYNMKNMIDALSKNNPTGEYDSILKDLEKLNPDGIPKSKAMKAIKGAVQVSAGTAFSASHPGYAAISVVNGFKNLMESIGLSKSAEDISNQDIVKWITNLTAKTDSEGAPLLTPNMYSDILTGKWDALLKPLKTAITRVTSESTGKGINDAFGS